MLNNPCVIAVYEHLFKLNKTVLDFCLYYKLIYKTLNILKVPHL